MSIYIILRIYTVGSASGNAQGIDRRYANVM